jgi:hypothetical protein
MAGSQPSRPQLVFGMKRKMHRGNVQSQNLLCRQCKLCLDLGPDLRYICSVLGSVQDCDAVSGKENDGCQYKIQKNLQINENQILVVILVSRAKKASRSTRDCIDEIVSCHQALIVVVTSCKTKLPGQWKEIAGSQPQDKNCPF